MSEIHIGWENDTIFVRVFSRGTWESSLGLLDYCRDAIDQGARVLVVDLSQCIYVDSTFCGMLVELAMLLKGNSESVIKVFGISGTVYKTMEELGLMQFFPVATSDAPPFSIKTSPLSTMNINKIKQAKHVLKAHESLVYVNEDNAVKFYDCIKILKQELEDANTLNNSNPTDQKIT